MSEIEEETDKKLNEIFDALKIEHQHNQEAMHIIKQNNDLVVAVRHCRSLSSLFQHAKNLDYAYKSFTTLKLNLLDIRIDDDLVVYTNDERQCVAKAIEIIGVKHFTQYVPIIRIQWYYNKWDLKEALDIYFDSVSEKEIFLSDQFDYIQPDTVIAIGKVLTFEQFDQLPLVTDFTYFTRAMLKNQKILPQPKKWEKHCKCRKPMNPDQFYVQCDKCNEWYHPTCLGFKNITSKIFFCYKCKQIK